MNRFHLGLTAIGALVAVAALGAQAQSPGPEAAASSAASSTMSAKESRAANRKLQKDVIRVLARTKGLSVTHITVRADNGKVTLEGAVPEVSQIDLATNAARNVPGVTSVRNTLTLSTF